MAKVTVDQDKPITDVQDVKPKTVSEDGEEKTVIDSLDYDNDEVYDSDTYYGGPMTSDSPPITGEIDSVKPKILEVVDDKPKTSIESE